MWYALVLTQKHGIVLTASLHLTLEQLSGVELFTRLYDLLVVYYDSKSGGSHRNPLSSTPQSTTIPAECSLTQSLLQTSQVSQSPSIILGY